MSERDRQPTREDARPEFRRSVAGIVATVALATAAVVALAGTTWIGTAFPGFFVLDNGVVASIGRPAWPSTKAMIYQHAVSKVDDTSVNHGADVYARVAARPAGTTFTYDLNATTGRSVQITSRLFSRRDYWLIFGAYVGTGLLYLLLAVAGATLATDPQQARALILVGSAGGAYALSGVGIYGPDGPLRLHALIEAFFPATLAGVALVFPRPWAAVARPGAIAAWCFSTALAIPYELLLAEPAAYSALHAACELYIGVAGVAVMARLAVAAAEPASDRSTALPSALVGAVLGLGAPAVMFVVSGATGGRLPVNACTATAFMFPLCFAYGLVREYFASRRGVPAAAHAATR